MINRWVGWVLPLVLMLVGAGTAFNFFEWIKQAGYYHRIVSLEVRSPVTAGGILHTETWVERNMPLDCYVTVSRFVSNEIGEVVFSQIVPGVIHDNGRQVAHRTVQIPTSLVPGTYTLEARAYADCGSFQRMSISPQAYFTVIP